MSTFPDGVFQYGGMPVGGGRYEGMWGSKVYFVDYDNGTDGAGGLSPGYACKYLDTAISLATINDVIYIRPRRPELGTQGAGPYWGGDPGDITPKVAATNWTIPYTKYGLSLIGTGTGVGTSAASRTCLQGGTTAGSPVFTVNAPYTTFENFGIKPGSSTTGLVTQSFLNDTVTQAYGNTYYNIWFRNVDAGAGYSLQIESGSYDNIINCNFSGHAIGIKFLSSNDLSTDTVIRNCDFSVLVASAKCDIQGTQVKRILIDHCRFNHVLPTGGSPNLYIQFGSASTGLVSDCYLGSVTATIASNMTLNGVGFAHIYFNILGA